MQCFDFIGWFGRCQEERNYRDLERLREVGRRLRVRERVRERKRERGGVEGEMVNGGGGAREFFLLLTTISAAIFVIRVWSFQGSNH